MSVWSFKLKSIDLGQMALKPDTLLVNLSTVFPVVPVKTNLTKASSYLKSKTLIYHLKNITLHFHKAMEI